MLKLECINFGFGGMQIWNQFCHSITLQGGDSGFILHSLWTQTKVIPLKTLWLQKKVGGEKERSEILSNSQDERETDRIAWKTKCHVNNWSQSVSFFQPRAVSNKKSLLSSLTLSPHHCLPIFRYTSAVSEANNSSIKAMKWSHWHINGLIWSPIVHLTFICKHTQLL